MTSKSYLTAFEIWEELERSGYSLNERNGKLAVKNKKDKMNWELLQRASNVKDELLALYRYAPTPLPELLADIAENKL